MRVLSRLFRRLFLEGLAALNQAGRLAFFGDLAPLGVGLALDKVGEMRRAVEERPLLPRRAPTASNLDLWRCHTSRHGGFEGSLSVKLTGPMPQIAMTTGSLWLRITPS